ncbi:hypothetical protein [Lactobacillus intestinalis]|uniref:hypothetical protein n=1 Tax=Lactobacillus intestinalis TaxID=151781 RepID=UPI00266FA51D|nr:hypothetical protein [Lactobacillus intestinalis]
MKKRRIGLTLLAIISATVALSACSDSDSNSNAESKISYDESTKSNKGKTYKLAFFENRADDNTEVQYYTLGYYKAGNLVTKNLYSDQNRYTEIIQPNLSEPYVVIENNKYYIHRPPYSQYNQPLIKGKVTAKEND